MQVKVTLDLESVNFYDTPKIMDALQSQISTYRRIGNITIDTREFTYKMFEGKVISDPLPCGVVIMGVINIKRLLGMV